MTNLAQKYPFHKVIWCLTTNKSDSCADETRAKCAVSIANIVTELYNITRNREKNTVRVISFVKNL